MEIVPYTDVFTTEFDRLNRSWIEEFFCVEPFDHAVLTKPKEMIIDRGGEVWFAAQGGRAIGTYALIPLEPGLFEFTKMGVDVSARGLGVARALVRHGAARARAHGHSKLRIFTSTRLVPACTLYRSEGYTEVAMTPEQRTRYARADIMFDLML